MINVAISLCPNDIFVFSALLLKAISNPYNFEVYPLGDLNRKLLENRYDFIKVSSLALINSSEYSVTRVGASLAKDKGPQLVKAEGSSPTGSVLGVPSLHATATKLAKRYYPNLEAKEYPLNQLSSLVSAGEIPYAVIINEDMNRLDELKLESVSDLGLTWNQEFDALLPLGVIGAKKTLPKSAISEFERLVNESIEWAKANPVKALKLTKKYTGEDDINTDHINLFTQDAHFNPSIPLYLNKLEDSVSI
ncbi:MAG: MqnA/MqnD/SBP family protein [Oligoflexales bacterium]